MTLCSGWRAIVLATLGVAMTFVPAVAEDLKVGGTGAVNGALQQLAPAFLADSGITLQIVASLGTSGGNAAVADGKLGPAIAGRDLKENEKAKGLRVAMILRTPFGLATSRAGPDGFKSSEIADLFWRNRPPADESDNIVMGDLFPGAPRRSRLWPAACRSISCSPTWSCRAASTAAKWPARRASFAPG